MTIHITPSRGVQSYSRVRRAPRSRPRLDFATINAAASSNAPAIVRQLLPDGKLHGQEWVARNPRRVDRTPGSFRVNIRSCKWADFATTDKGGDLISLVAYLADVRQAEAARRLAAMLHLDAQVRS